MKGKQRSAQSWLPSQVHYGVDCSDSDPEKWTPFGEVQQELEKHATTAPKSGPAKAVLPG